MIDFSPILTDAINLIFALLATMVPVIGAWVFKTFKALQLESRSLGLIKEKQFADWLTQAAREGVGYAEEWAHKKVLDISKVEVRNEVALMGARFMVKQYPDTIKWFKDKQGFNDGDLVSLVMSYMFTPDEKVDPLLIDPVKVMYPSASDTKEEEDKAKENALK